MSENSREERILAYLLEECDEAESFEVERLCRENPLWQKDKVHYGQVLGLVRDAVITPAEKELPEQECKLTDQQRTELRNLLPHQPDENVNQKVESPSMNAKDPKRKKLITLGVPLAAAAMAVAIAYWANSESTETPDKQIAAATVSNEREPVPLTNGNQSEKQPASYLPVPTPAFTSNSTLAMKMAIQEEAGQVLALRTANEIKEMQNQMVNDLPSAKKIIDDSSIDKKPETESKRSGRKDGNDTSSSLANAFAHPLNDSPKAVAEIQLNSTADKIDNSVEPKNKGPLMCFIAILSFFNNLLLFSSSHSFSLLPVVTSEESSVRSPIFFINIKDAIIRPIPTAYTKFHTVDKTITTSITTTSELMPVLPILMSRGSMGMARNPL